MNSRLLTLVLGILFLTVGTACSTGTETESEFTPTITPTAETQLLNVSTPDATQAPLLLTLEIWWPDRLTAAEDEDLADILSQQIESFRSSEENIEIEFRLKQSGDIGGILSTLRSAASVAPDALPDITLMRREDLLSAAQSGLIQPIEGLVPSALITDLYPTAVQLGTTQVGDQTTPQLYGVTYLLDAQIVAYRQNEKTEGMEIWSFENLLDREFSYAFPAVRSTNMANSFLIQYISAGGDLNIATIADIDFDALTEVLSFYESAVESGVIDPEVVNYSQPADYITLLEDGTLDSGVMNVSTFIPFEADNSDFQMGFIPTANGEPASVLNGWVWVIVTPNTDQQVLAARFINWMMDTDRQAQFSEAVSILPSRPQALVQWDSSLLDAALLNQLLSNTILFPTEASNNVAYRIMQSSLISVISGESTVSEVIELIRDQLSD